jgi:acetyl-CoA carboxylase carboxyl transferase subunit beta
MRLKNVFKKTTYISLNHPEEGGENADKTRQSHSPNVPEGTWLKCPSCGTLAYREDMLQTHYTCAKCGNYFSIDAYTRLKIVLDEGSFEEWNEEMEAVNPLNFDGYEEKITQLKQETQINEAVVTGQGKIHGVPVVIGVCDTRFLMGSMGYIVGEKITRAFEKATKLRLPVILFTCSGGARMQEGMVSLMQMAKTAAAIKRHSEAGLLYITVLTHPTTGGVTASFAMLGDVILAEPKALIGFAGPRVIRQTIGQRLPEGFQRSEFQLEHGFVDAIVKRESLVETLYRILRLHFTPSTASLEEYHTYLDQKWDKHKMDKEIRKKKTTDSNAWNHVQTARMEKRPTAIDYIGAIFKQFYELHGDRLYGDDNSIIGGIALFGNTPVTVIAQEKGKNLKDRQRCNFGMPYPEGYRKALRLMKQAEKFGRPIICIVDTPGAYPGIGAEERGQGEAIAKNLAEMSALKVPILSIVIGEGGSGGALALAVANEVWMMENSIYSILSPEGFASILWKDSKRADEAAQVMKITSEDLLELGIIEKIIPEFPVATEENVKKQAFVLRKYIGDFLAQEMPKNEDELVNERYLRFRKM